MRKRKKETEEKHLNKLKNPMVAGKHFYRQRFGLQIYLEHVDYTVDNIRGCWELAKILVSVGLPWEYWDLTCNTVHRFERISKEKIRRSIYYGDSFMWSKDIKTYNAIQLVSTFLQYNFLPDLEYNRNGNN